MPKPNDPRVTQPSEARLIVTKHLVCCGCGCGLVRVRGTALPIGVILSWPGFTACPDQWKSEWHEITEYLMADARRKARRLKRRDLD